MKTQRLLMEVMRERTRQDEKWGEQNHPDGTGEENSFAKLAREHYEVSFQNNAGTWAHILREEVEEAMAEKNPEKLKTELIQVAAVCVAWIEAIYRRQKA